jgi:hypothetical protein
MLTAPSGTTAGTYYVLVYSGSTSIVASAAFTVTGPTLALTPTSGPNGASITLSGANYIISAAYNDCLSASSTSIASCVAGSTSGFIASGTGTIPSGTTVTVPAGTALGAYFVLVYSGTTVVSSSPFSVTPTLILTPNTGTVGTTVGLSGSGYTPSTLYSYCFSSSANSACPSGTATTFTSTAGGGIPASVTIVVPHSSHTYVDVSQGNAGTNFVVSAAFSIQPAVVQANFVSCTSTSCVVTLNSAVFAGDELAVSVATSVTGSSSCAIPNTPTDGLGTVYLATTGITVSNGGGTKACAYSIIYYAPVPVAGGASDTVTVTLGKAASTGVVEVYEVSGVATGIAPTIASNTCNSCGSASLTSSGLTYPANSFIVAVGATATAAGTPINSISASGGSPTFHNSYGTGNNQYVGYSNGPTTAATGKTFTMTASANPTAFVILACQFTAG